MAPSLAISPGDVANALNTVDKPNGTGGPEETDGTGRHKFPKRSGVWDTGAKGLQSGVLGLGWVAATKDKWSGIRAKPQNPFSDQGEVR